MGYTLSCLDKGLVFRGIDAGNGVHSRSNFYEFVLFVESQKVVCRKPLLFGDLAGAESPFW
jgi:hypothetical protein